MQSVSKTDCDRYFLKLKKLWTMKLKNYFKMDSTKKLTLAERLVYIFICAYSNGKVSHITRQTLMDLTGIKKADTITKHTNKLEDLGLIKKIYKKDNGKKLVEYHITQIDNGFICISNDILNILKTTDLSFAISLAALRYVGTNKIQLSNNEIISKLNISKSTFYRCISALIENGIIIKISDGYLMNADLFFVFKAKSNKAKKMEKDMLKMSNDTVSYKIFMNAYSKNYDGINNIEKFLIWCSAGCPGLNNKESISDYTKISYNF